MTRGVGPVVRKPPPSLEELAAWLDRVRAEARAAVSRGGRGGLSGAGPEGEPEITVSMPARNVEAYVAEAVSSVLAQEDVALELIVVDDASEDGTAAVARAVGDARVEVVRQPSRRGIGAAHNVVTARARGRFVVHVDADDIVLPGGLAAAVAPLRAMPSAAQTYSDFFDIDAEGRIDATAYRSQLTRFDRRHRTDVTLGRELLVHGMVANHLRAYRREALLAVGGFDESLAHGEDWAMTLTLADRFDVVATGGWHYARRIHDANTSVGPGMTPLRLWRDHLPVLRRMMADRGGRLCGYGRLEVGSLVALRWAHAAGVIPALKRAVRGPRPR